MGKPLIYYCISTIVGCISALLVFENQLIGAAVMAASFLAVMVFTVDYKKFCAITFLFLCISFINYNIYFDHVSFINENISLRIKEKGNYNFIGEYKGKKLILKGNLNNVNVGDIIKVNGEFEKKPLYDQGIVGTYKIHNIKIRNSDFIAKMYEFRRTIYARNAEIIGEEKAGIISAACFGDVTYIDREEKDNFNRLGILHVVSVSGLHLAIIYKLLEGVGGLKIALPVSFIYVVFTGGEPATFRAFIMILILKMAKKVFRNYDKYSALSISAMLLIFYRPYYITDIGFNLSFLSMLGIFLTYEKIRNKLIVLPESLNEAISLSLSAQFLTAPYIISTLNNFTIGFIAGNVLLIPLFSVLVVVGNISMIFIKLPMIFNLLAKILDIILTAIEGGSKLLLYISPETLKVSMSWAFFIVLFYCAYMLFKAGKRKYVYLPLIIIPMLFFENYKIIPLVNFEKINYTNCIIFKYKEENVLIIDEKNKSILKNTEFIKEKRINEVIICNKSEENIKVKGYSLKVIKSKDNSFLILEIRNRFAGKILLPNNGEDYDSINKNYDIIRLNLRSENKKTGSMCSVRILFGRYYLVT